MFEIRSRESKIAAESGLPYACHRAPFGWAVRAASSPAESVAILDYLSSRSAAEFAARELSAGRAHIEHHRPLGCRVQPGAAR
jgi:hypothetical protein